MRHKGLCAKLPDARLMCRSQRMARRNHKFSALVMEIVKSVPFQQRRGELDKGIETAAR